MASGIRYAVYYAPEPSSPLARFGAGVLGTDPASGADAAFHPGPPFDEPTWPALTAEPRRYGFHATLKAPFSLSEPRREADLVFGLRDFARARAGFVVPSLQVATLGAFVALVPSGREPRLDGLAADAVRIFEPFRAPLSAADRARRLAAPLTERQLRHLDEWGYPYVFEEFRFHMTLTGSLPEERREGVRAALAARYLALPPGLPVDAVTLFRQDGRGSRFRVLERCPLGR